MKRVCIVRRKHYPWQRNMRRNAETLVKEGYEVDVICVKMEGQPRREVMNGVNIYRLPLGHHRGKVFWYVVDYAAFFLLASLKLAQLSVRRKYDAVEVHTMPDFLVFTAIFPRILGSKVILYMFENMPALFISTFKTKDNHVGARVLRLIERVSAGWAHHVFVADGVRYKNVLVERGIPSEKITVILNVPDDSVFNVGAPALRVSNNGTPFNLIVVSTMVRRYGVQTLVRAVPLLVPDIPNLTVKVVGDGEYLPELKKLAQDMGVERYLDFVGLVPYERVPSLLKEADVALAPMVDDVGHPNKVFEYFAAGKPTVASALPGLTTFFDRDCLMYFRPGDEKDLATKVKELYSSPEKRAELSERARAFYQAHCWRNTKRDYLKVYEELLS